MIEFFESRLDLQRPGTVGGNLKLKPEWKTDTEIGFGDENDDDPWIYTDFVYPCIDEYKTKHPYIDTIDQWEVDSHYKMQRYRPGEGYHKLHCENEGMNPDGSYRRLLAWMVYLNDVTDGGHTEFPAQKKKFQPRRGDILIWPAYWTHPHRGVVSKTQVKYILTGWSIFIGDPCKDVKNCIN